MAAATFHSNAGSKLFLCIHHLLVDVVSWNILASDILLAIQQKKAGKEIELPEKTASFIEWSELLKEYSSERKIRDQKVYWERIAVDMSKGRLNIPTGTGKGYQIIHRELSAQAAESLLKNAGEAFHADTRTLLVSALAVAVKRLTGQDMLTLCTEGHGREELHKKISVDRTVGWFTAIFPAVFRCIGSFKC